MKTLAMLLMVASSLAAQSEVKWETNLAAAQKRATAEHKVIFMDVWTEWCGWCIKLQKDTFPSPEAQAALRKVVPLSIKTQLRNGTPTADQFIEKQYGVDAYPMLIILDANGRELERKPGFLQPKPFGAWLSQAAKSR
jgi:thiol:disulfide interchange protein